MDIIEGSYGGRSGKDGLDAVDTLYANTRNNPIEDIESHYPLRVTPLRARPRTAAGRAQWRGGLGSIREFEFLEAAAASRSRATATPSRRPGLFGGADGTPGARRARPRHGGGTLELPSKIPYRRAAPATAAARRPVRRRLRRPAERERRKRARARPRHRLTADGPLGSEAPGAAVAAALAAAARSALTPAGGVTAARRGRRSSLGPTVGSRRSCASSGSTSRSTPPATCSPAGRREAGRRVMAAHTSTPSRCGGRFDGVLGVVASVHAVRDVEGGRLRAGATALGRRVHGRGGHPLPRGAVRQPRLRRPGLTRLGDRRDAGGTTLREAMAAAGYDLARAGDAARIGDVGAFLELHVEQGPVLERPGLEVGVVTSIVGLRGYRVRLRGEANHAGTTPMALRRDAFAGAARIALELRDFARSRSSVTVNVGKLAIEPGGANVVPGRADFTIDVRAATPDGIEAWERVVEETVCRIAAEEGLEVELRRPSRSSRSSSTRSWSRSSSVPRRPSERRRCGCRAAPATTRW